MMQRDRRPTPYVMESPRESERLEAKTDPEDSRRQLALVGLRSGQRVLDAGGGTGAVARIMSEIVGESGCVVCLDRSADRLAVGAELARRSGRGNLKFTLGDVMAPPLQGEFDLCWARFVIEYLPDPLGATRALARTLRSGGKLVLGDVDGHGLFLDPLSESLRVGLDALIRGLVNQFDPFAGRKLYGYLAAAGLVELEAHVLPYHVYAGSAAPAELENWMTKFVVIRKAVVAEFDGDAAYDRFVDEFLTHLRAPDTFLYSTLILAEGISRG